MEQVRVRMPDDLIEIIRRVADDLALTLDDSTTSFSTALRYLVRRGARDHFSNGHDGEHQNANPYPTRPHA